MMRIATRTAQAARQRAAYAAHTSSVNAASTILPLATSPLHRRSISSATQLHAKQNSWSSSSSSSSAASFVPSADAPPVFIHLHPAPESTGQRVKRAFRTAIAGHMRTFITLAGIIGGAAALDWYFERQTSATHIHRADPHARLTLRVERVEC